MSDLCRLVANKVALSMYRRGWAQPSEHFTARTKYLALADKASRTVALLTERLDQHRGRGQQQIVVKHVTVNADQALVTDNPMMCSRLVSTSRPIATKSMLRIVSRITANASWPTLPSGTRSI